MGEDNPYGSDPRYALFPLPANSAGGRLARILGLSKTEYLRRFDRVNLCRSHWDLNEARGVVHQVMRERDKIVLLGSKVRYAFAMEDQQYFTRLTETLVDGQPPTTFYVLPHPSGRCRAWDDPRSTEQARLLLREFLS